MANIFSEILADLEAAWAKIFGTSGATLTAAVVADIKVIGSGLTGALTAFEAVTGLDGALVAKVQSIVASIETAALSVTTAIETNIAKPIVVQIQSDFAALQSALAPISLPTAIDNILKAVETLLPYVEAGVGILTAATVGAAEATGFTHDEAFGILSGVTAPAVGLSGRGPDTDKAYIKTPPGAAKPAVGVHDPALADVVNEDGSVTHPDGSVTYANPGAPTGEV